jgi:hypothetical protein
MLLAQKKRFWTYTILALLTQVLHLFTLEFYAGIDLLRPAFLWLVMTNNPSTREKIKSISFKWFPYLIVFITFFIWRGFFYEAAAEGRNVPLLLTGLLTDPIPTLITTVSNGIPDLVLILITSWYKLIEPINFLITDSANRYILFITIISFFIFLFFFSKQDYINNSESRKPTTTSYFLIGAAALILGLIPAFTAGFVIHAKIEPWNSRFSLGPSLGAALIITSLIDYLIKVPRSRWVILSIIFGLLIGWHLRSTNNFRWAWQKQVNFYRQLYLRAPEISPGTAILAEEEVLGYMGDYPTSYGINSIYTPQGSGFENLRSVDYWFYPLPEFSGKFYDYLAGESFSDERAGIIFQGEEKGSIVITFAPEFDQCLWVIRPEYAVAKSLPQTTRLLASISYVDRIKQAPQNPDSFLLKYLYTNPVQDWCYYYQKADLAYQYEEWDEVIALWESANDSGLQPENGFEYLPFIEAYANRGDWQTAKKMTRTSQKTMQGIDPLLCNIWEKLDGNTTASTEKDDTILSVRENLKCDQP